MRVAAVAVATAAIVWVLVITPYQMDHHLYSDAPGLAVLAAANRAWAWNDAYAQNVLLWIAGVSAAVLLLPIVLRRFAPRLLARADGGRGRDGRDRGRRAWDGRSPPR